VKTPHLGIKPQTANLQPVTSINGPSNDTKSVTMILKWRQSKKFPLKNSPP